MGGCKSLTLKTLIGALGDFPEPSKIISNKSPSDSRSYSSCLRLFTVVVLLLAFNHSESILPMEKSSLLSSYPSNGELVGRWEMKHGFGVLCRFAGAYLKALWPMFTRTLMSAFAAIMG
nr:hypothetical protein Iba_chr01bCG17180 [Ipomoea batatas]